jgi:Asp-tRNA(Asn)/Glu-tRNA(Gln) amidotransferase A subunit family amidase
MSVPFGTGAHGMPVGIQVLALLLVKHQCSALVAPLKMLQEE